MGARGLLLHDLIRLISHRHISGRYSLISSVSPRPRLVPYDLSSSGSHPRSKPHDGG